MCLFDRKFGAGREVGWTAVREIAGFVRVALDVQVAAAAAAAAAAAEGLVVVDRRAALAVVAVVPVDCPEVAVVAEE